MKSLAQIVFGARTSRWASERSGRPNPRDADHRDWGVKQQASHGAFDASGNFGREVLRVQPV